MKIAEHQRGSMFVAAAIKGDIKAIFAMCLGIAAGFIEEPGVRGGSGSLLHQIVFPTFSCIAAWLNASVWRGLERSCIFIAAPGGYCCTTILTSCGTNICAFCAVDSL